MATASVAMTTDEFLALPEEEGVSRELIDGQVISNPMTTRNPKHAFLISRISQVLCNWQDRERKGGMVVGGEARCRLTRDPDTIVGIDVAYFGRASVEGLASEESFFDGPPILAVEILSPTDNHQDVTRKVQRYLASGTLAVWVVDPLFCNVLIHRPDGSQSFFANSDELRGEPELPGLLFEVADLFAGVPQPPKPSN